MEYQRNPVPFPTAFDNELEESPLLQDGPDSECVYPIPEAGRPRPVNYRPVNYDRDDNIPRINSHTQIPTPATDGANTTHSAIVDNAPPTSSMPVLRRKEKTPFFTARVKLCLILCLLTPFVIMGATSVSVVETYECEDVTVTASVHPDDTVLAAQLTGCQEAHALLTPVKSPRDLIDVYVTDCNNLTIHSESQPYTSPPYPDVDNAIVMIDQSHKSGSNYYGKNTTVEITAHLASHNSTEVFACLFRNSSIFDKFKYPEDMEHFSSVLKLATWCEKIHVAPDATRKMTIAINSTGYYFGGFSSFNLRLDSLQFNLSITRLFYKRSDFLGDHVSCHLTLTSSNCSVNNSYSNTCIMLHATSTDIDDFNYITVDAAKQPVYRNRIFRIVMISVGAFSSVLLLLIIIFILSFTVTKYYFSKTKDRYNVV